MEQGAGLSHPGLACGLRMRERKEYLRHQPPMRSERFIATQLMIATFPLFLHYFSATQKLGSQKSTRSGFEPGGVALKEEPRRYDQVDSTSQALAFCLMA
jgi:hypothetical protein